MTWGIATRRFTGFNSYAFRFPVRLTKTLSLTKTLNRVLKSSGKLPALTKIYPQHEYVEKAFAKKTPLHKAFEASDKKKFLQLLKEGSDPNFRPLSDGPSFKARGPVLDQNSAETWKKSQPSG